MARKIKAEVINMDNGTGEGNGVTTLALPISQQLIDDYTQAGFKASEVEGYERDAQAVRDGMMQSTLGFVAAGEVLTSMRERAQRGSWYFLLNTRVGVSEDTAERMMNAYKAVQAYPLLTEIAGKVGGTTLALIGARKTPVDGSTVAEIVNLAETGEATTEDVREILRKNAPVKEPKATKVKTFFKNMPVERAAQYHETLVHNQSQVVGTLTTAGANLAGLQKSAQFKAYVRDTLAGGDNLSDLQKSLAMYLAACYMIDHPTSGQE
jgi:hypothetical protein